MQILTRFVVVGLFLYLASSPESKLLWADDFTPPTRDTINAARVADFEGAIAPLLQARCVNCHGRKTQSAGLRLDSRAGILKGAESGPVVVPGRTDSSRLMDVIAGTAEDQVVMPPEGPRLRADEVALVKEWVQQGLPWPPSVALDRSPEELARSHWAFRPIVRPDLTFAPQAHWASNGLDSIVAARLQAEGITPSEEADRRTFIRRVTLDLTGLPPTPAEVDTFIEDASPDAVEKIVDRLLASPRYGERWARPWLDLCHYGDTDGYLTDQIRPVAWRYRQWLIDALNGDLSLRDFTVHQLAGDLLPNATESQYLATGFLRNTLSNREGGADLEEYRVEQIVDRTSMVGTGWLGLTVGCARCHDHKYDPISQSDFYGLYAFFDQADEVNIDAPLPGELEPYLTKKGEYDRRRAELIAPHLDAINALQRRWEARMLQAVANPGEDYHWDRMWEVLGLIWGGELGEGQLEGCQIVLLPWERRTPSQRDRLQDYFLKHGERTDPAQFKELKLAELSTRLTELAREVPALSRAPAMREAQVPRQAYVHIRGDFRVHGDNVSAAVPEWLTPSALSPETVPRRSSLSRLDLASWLVSREQPLTSRVFVNRAWQELFGRGLVGTVDNFGTQGERPTQLELLDWLADEFRVREGSFKSLHRLIVTSATYRQSSRFRPELQVRDPQNKLFARQVSLRLSAEQIRDTALAVSGLLTEQVGGPSVFPPQPDAVAMEGFDNKWKPSTGADRYRRGLYTWLQRLSPFAQGVTFDAPSNARVCSRRERSNTPLQALTLLNDPVFWEAAQALSRRLKTESPGDFDQRLDWAFKVCLGRSPGPSEREQLAKHYREQVALLKTQAETAATVVGSPSHEPDAAEVAAWTSVSSILLNLHEFITRD